MNYSVLKKVAACVLIFGGSGNPLGAMLPRNMTVSHNSLTTQRKHGASNLQRLTAWFEVYFGSAIQPKKSGKLQAQHVSHKKNLADQKK